MLVILCSRGGASSWPGSSTSSPWRKPGNMQQSRERFLVSINVSAKSWNTGIVYPAAQHHKWLYCCSTSKVAPIFKKKKKKKKKKLKPWYFCSSLLMKISSIGESKTGWTRFFKVFFFFKFIFRLKSRRKTTTKNKQVINCWGIIFRSGRLNQVNLMGGGGGGVGGRRVLVPS